MTPSIDLNSDLGEMPDPQSVARDIEILSVVTSCNIACGGHAGDGQSMQTMVEQAVIKDVRIGAHPSYPDRENFGRKTIKMDDITLHQSLTEQIKSLAVIALKLEAKVTYVKPHGALYNDCTNDKDLAALIVDIVKEIDPSLSIMGLAHSHIEKAALNNDINFISEAFIDRRYTSDARLVSRTNQGAVITDIYKQKEQAIALAKGNEIYCNDDSQIAISAQSLCMHSDTPNALQNAIMIKQCLLEQGIKICA